MTNIEEKVARALFYDQFQHHANWSEDDYNAEYNVWPLKAKYAIEAHTAALTEAGYVIVPVEPTEVMLEAGEEAAFNCLGHEVFLSDCLIVNKAMIEAMIATPDEGK